MLTIGLALSSMQAYAQWNNDSTEMDSYNRYRVGGYGEVVAQFKNYGINRFNGTSTGNSDVKRNTISIPRKAESQEKNAKQT